MKTPLFLKRNRFAKRTFIKIFTYNVIISLSILLLTLFALYFSFKTIVTREIHNKSIELLVQTQSIFNSLHEWIIPSFIQIKSEPTISTLIYSNKPTNMEISAGIDRLMEVLTSYYLLDSIYIYNHQTGQYFSTINGFEDTDCSDQALPEIMNDIRDYGVYRYIPRKMTYRINNNVYRGDSTGTETVNVFSIVVGDIPSANKAIRGALTVNISEQKISDNFFSTYTGTDTELIIIDNTGKFLIHPDKEKIGETDLDFSYIRAILESGNEEGVFTDTINNQQYLISYITHPSWGWRFINVVPYDSIFSNLTDFLIINAIVFVLLMVLSITLAYFTSQKIFLPIHKLFQYALDLKEYVNEEDGTGTRKRISELQYVDRVFRKIIKNTDTMSDTIEKHQEQLKQDLIRGLVLGELDSEAIESCGEYLGEELNNASLIAAVLRLDNFPALSETFHGDEISRFFRILKELVSHYISESEYFLSLGKDHLCIICQLQPMDINASSNYYSIKSAFTTIQKAIQRQLKITITIGLSDIFDEYTHLQEKYNLCLDATQLRFRYGCNSIILIDKLNASKEQEYIFPEKNMTRLFKELSLGKILKVEQELGEILDHVREYEFEDYNFMVQFISYQTMKYVNKMKDSLKDSTITLKELMQKLKEVDTLEELKEELMEIYSLITEVLGKKQSNRLDKLAEKINSYVEANIKETSLCTESISDKMGVTAYYSRFAYKKVFGGSLFEKINTLRLEYCKEQLINTRLPVKKIYTGAGFYNYSYFFTLFKKNTGLTPNQFRIQKTEI